MQQKFDNAKTGSAKNSLYWLKNVCSTKNSLRVQKRTTNCFLWRYGGECCLYLDNISLKSSEIEKVETRCKFWLGKFSFSGLIHLNLYSLPQNVQIKTYWKRQYVSKQKEFINSITWPNLFFVVPNTFNR